MEKYSLEGFVLQSGPYLKGGITSGPWAHARTVAYLWGGNISIMDEVSEMLKIRE